MSNQIQKQKESNIVFSLEVSRERDSTPSAHKSASLGNQKKVERTGAGIKGPILTTQATRIILPTKPQDQKLPSHESKEPEKASSVSVTASKEMKTIQAFCRQYHEDDIYNMDETLLHCRHVLYPTLAPKEIENNSQMTLAFCVNSSGSDKLPIWVITSEEKPVSLNGLDARAFGAVWNCNKNSTMTAEAMQSWLRHFYFHIGNQRSVILLLDNLVGHKKGVELMPPPSNIRILWLPPRTTKRYQPLDQGINSALKSHYQQIWIKHMFGKLYSEELMNPIHAMSSELAIYWIVQIWKHHITSKTIHNCFCKSSVIQPRPPGPASKMCHTQQRWKAALWIFLNTFDWGFYTTF